MKLSRTLGVLLVLLTSLPAAQLSATLITFNSRISFTQFAPGLPVESFASLNPGNGNISVCDSPLHDSSCGGSLLPGISYEGTLGTNGIAITGPGFFHMPNVVAVFVNLFGGTLTLRLTAPADAIGFNLFSISASTIDVSVFDPNGIALGMFRVPAGVGGDVFFG